MDTKLNIIVIEDHDVMREMIVESLQSKGHHVVGIDCAEALAEIQGSLHVDLLLVDLNLPGESGLSLTKRLRVTHPDLGIIMLTARGQLSERMEGYETGADIYLTKPIPTEELNAAINALARRLRHNAIKDDTLRLDIIKLTLANGQKSIGLTENETALLEAFSLASGGRLETWQLNDVLGKTQDANSKSSLEMQITRLRKKMLQVCNEPNPIKSIRQFGYQLCVLMQVN